MSKQEADALHDALVVAEKKIAEASEALAKVQRMIPKT